MRYSVIVPVYMAEHTIERCIESLVSQNFGDTEILLINDGSPDSSGEICREYAKKYSCIRYLEKENGGVSSARNEGLQNARGEYILFVDSDDYVAENYFKVIDRKQRETDADLLLFGMESIEKKVEIWDTGTFNVLRQNQIADRISRAMKAYLFPTLMMKVFKRKIINEFQLSFDETLAIGEDLTFIFEYSMHIKSMASIKDILYYWIGDNSNSLSRKKRDYLRLNLIRSNERMLEALYNSRQSQRNQRIYFNAISWVYYRSAYSCCKELLKFDLPKKERIRQIREICIEFSNKGFYPKEINGWIIAVPVICKWAKLIDKLVKIQYRRRLRV